VTTAFSCQNQRQHRSGLHERDNLGEERLVSQVGVVLRQQCIGQTKDLGRLNTEPRLLKTTNHLAGEVLLHAIRLTENQQKFE